MDKTVNFTLTKSLYKKAYKDFILPGLRSCSYIAGIYVLIIGTFKIWMATEYGLTGACWFYPVAGLFYIGTFLWMLLSPSLSYKRYAKRFLAENGEMAVTFAEDITATSGEKCFNFDYAAMTHFEENRSWFCMCFGKTTLFVPKAAFTGDEAMELRLHIMPKLVSAKKTSRRHRLTLLYCCTSLVWVIGAMSLLDVGNKRPVDVDYALENIYDVPYHVVYEYEIPDGVIVFVYDTEESVIDQIVITADEKSYYYSKYEGESLLEVAQTVVESPGEPLYYSAVSYDDGYLYYGWVLAKDEENIYLLDPDIVHEFNLEGYAFVLYLQNEKE